MTEPVVLGPAFPVHHTLIAGDVTGATLIFGQTFVKVPDAVNGIVPVEPGARWLASVHMPAPTIAHLHKQLTMFLENYTAKFGPIPFDPALVPPAEGSPVSYLRPVATEEAAQVPVRDRDPLGEPLFGPESHRDRHLQQGEAGRPSPWPWPLGPKTPPPA